MAIYMRRQTQTGSPLDAVASEWHLLNISQCDGKKALIRIGTRHGKEDAPDALDHPGSDFEQFEPEGIDCCSSQLGPGKTAAQVPQQNEGEGVQQQPKLVGLKPGATQPVGLEMNLEFLDPVFGIAAAGVNAVINPSGGFKDVGHHKAGVEAFGESFHFGNNPTRSLPRSRSMVKAAKESLLFTCFGELCFGFEHQVGGTFAKAIIGNQAD